MPADMRFLETAKDPQEQIRAALTAGSPADDDAVEQTVREIIARVRSEGDAALLDLGRRFDSPDWKASPCHPSASGRRWKAFPVI